ncbi:hypothetical protein WJX73_005530 [Symbiochloris irregularis]|uniref:Apple domain-containing protein n=1 Tax=Symbiochloris irregularis TaxID=706552 RepID=A0AAW1NK55_9CHLO
MAACRPAGGAYSACRNAGVIITLLLLSIGHVSAVQPDAGVLLGQRLPFQTPVSSYPSAPSLSGLFPNLHDNDDFALHLPPALPAASQSISQQEPTAVLAARDSLRNVSRRHLLAPPRPEFGKYTDLEVPKELNTPIECRTDEGYAWHGRVLQSGNSVKMSDMDHCRKACQDNHECSAWMWCNEKAGCTVEDGSHIASNYAGKEWAFVSMVKELLETTPTHVAEWILYMDSEAIFDDPSVTFAFEFYRGRDVVLTGDSANWDSGKISLDPNMVLIRNCERSRELFQRLDSMSGWEFKAPTGEKVKEALTRVLQEDGHRWLKRLQGEHSLCLNCHYKELDLELSSQTSVVKTWDPKTKRRNLFVVRFFGCDMCGNMPGEYEDPAACLQAWKDHYQWGYCRLHKLARMADREKEQGVPLQLLDKIVNIRGFDVTTWKSAVPKPNEVLSQERAVSSQVCWKRCMETQGCSFWVWCNQHGGCDQAGVFDGSYPFQTCTLHRLPTGVSPYEWQRGPEASTFASGFITGGGLGKHHERSTDRLVMLSGIPTSPCTLPWGDHFVSLATQNKQDWCRLHGHEFHVMASSCDLRIRPGPWQKIAMMRQALDEVSRDRAEWIAWIDMDIILGDIAFTFPLDKANYTGRDIITWGGRKAILAGDAYNGINTGVMLLRNTDFTRHIMDLTLHFGQFPVNMSTEQVLKDNLPTYDIGMLEQMSMVYVLKQRPEYIPRLYFEHGYCFNCWYQDLDDPRIAHPAFVIHFAGCKMCAGLHVDRLGLCDSIFVRAYAEAFARLLKIAPERGL